jgi:hypothetical protein
MSDIEFTSEAINDPQFGCRWLVSGAGYSVVAASITEGQEEIRKRIAHKPLKDSFNAKIEPFSIYGLNRIASAFLGYLAALGDFKPPRRRVAWDSTIGRKRRRRRARKRAKAAR